MTTLRTIRACAAALALGATAACATGAGNTIDSVLGAIGSAAGGGQAQQGQAQGTVRGVDTRAQLLALQLSDGSNVNLNYDQQTTVVYQNQRYAVTNLEPGDRVTVTVQATSNNGYYVSAVQVDQSASGSVGGTTPNGAGTGNVQSVQGTVQQIDVNNGLFSIDAGNGYQYTVSLPYGVSRADSDRFRALRRGERVRFYGVFLNNSRIELRQFY